LNFKDKETTQKKQQEDKLIEGENKSIRPSLFVNPMCSSFLVCFEQSKKAIDVLFEDLQNLF
jgi:hypothetical protein